MVFILLVTPWSQLTGYHRKNTTSFFKHCCPNNCYKWRTNKYPWITRVHYYHSTRSYIRWDYDSRWHLIHTTRTWINHPSKWNLVHTTWAWFNYTSKWNPIHTTRTWFNYISRWHSFHTTRNWLNHALCQAWSSQCDPSAFHFKSSKISNP